MTRYFLEIVEERKAPYMGKETKALFKTMIGPEKALEVVEHVIGEGLPWKNIQKMFPEHPLLGGERNFKDPLQLDLFGCDAHESLRWGTGV